MRPIADDPTTVAGITRAEGSQSVSPAAADAVAATPSTAHVSPGEALAAAVAAGELDPAVAAERLVAATVAAQRPARVSPEVWSAVEREVSALLADDPALADLLAPI
ncbi:hypothetical protein SAMN02745121_00727 [Nannocystis exedens]|uniref:Uncharacterized protein n=1 Tax=Nannocystis exedens TaxID=54 RepID=A0A1I1TI70_9BACT|nr:hypothetical protein [Nannocystis exedens]PCC66544.1 hypothetical protein NAEX_09132 [Nannocystis exedens]SFD58272.1 hypothetical protein SAMN02745121_00727 [Nannocystis exedens]